MPCEFITDGEGQVIARAHTSRNITEEGRAAILEMVQAARDTMFNLEDGEPPIVAKTVSEVRSGPAESEGAVLHEQQQRVPEGRQTRSNRTPARKSARQKKAGTEVRGLSELLTPHRRDREEVPGNLGSAEEREHDARAAAENPLHIGRKTATRRIHYVIKDCYIGCGKNDVTAIRCSVCNADFHIDRTPGFCPMCGAKFDGEKRFGEK